MSEITDDLEVTERVFRKLIESRTKNLVDSASILSTDFAFKQTIITYDHSTILSALENLIGRIDSDAIMLVDMNYVLIADTMRPQVDKEDFFAPQIIEEAEEYGDSSSIVFIEENAHQIMVVPILAPDPIAWLCVSFMIDQKLVRKLQDLTLSHITLFRYDEDSKPSKITSTLPNDLAQKLIDNLEEVKWNSNKSFLIDLGKSPYVTLVTTLDSMKEGFASDSGPHVVAVLQRSFEEALEPFYRLRFILIIISGSSLFFCIIAGILIAKSVTKPVISLVKGSREIRNGNYEYVVSIHQEDEIGELGNAFNNMTRGLVEREKVKNILGKVVSPAIAQELVDKEIRLGGEERSVTSFFSDIVGFTSISEKLSPADLVSLLNEYLSAMAEIINDTGGVVDKFIGDAIVAFWGAPIPKENHAVLGVKSAIRMQKKLNSLRAQWREAGKDEIFMRIGLNSGPVVVGNMGSKDRMNYTIMGDTVNLAARLEGANKYYRSEILISEFTLSQIGKEFLCRELDLVRVQGKKEAIRIFEVVDEIKNASDEQVRLVKTFEQALHSFRQKEWEKALEVFNTCNNLRQNGNEASRLYIRRIESIINTPPPKDWDFVYDLAK